MKQLYENENLIFLPFAILAAIVLVLAIIAFVKFRKLETDEDPVPCDDLPARYEDYEEAFYSPLNWNMKKVLSIIALSVLLACNGVPGPAHEMRYSDDGKDSVVHVSYFDGRSFNEFYLSYMAFYTLFEEGGYDKCFEYHLDHELPEYWMKKYSTYKPKRD